MTDILTHTPTEAKALAAAYALEAAGFKRVCGAPLIVPRGLSWVGDTRGLLVLAAEVLRLRAEVAAATERAERAEAEVAVLRRVVAAGDALAVECDAFDLPQDIPRLVSAYRLARATLPR